MAGFRVGFAGAPFAGGLRAYFWKAALDCTSLQGIPFSREARGKLIVGDFKKKQACALSINLKFTLFALSN